MAVFVKNEKYECGLRLKVKMSILFYGDSPSTVFPTTQASEIASQCTW
jgi:hypothetical protein